MFGRGRGGLEQNFVVYHQAIQAGGNQVVSFLDARAAILPDVVALRVPIQPLTLWSRWDPFSTARVRRALREEQPDVVITHGNRAGRILLRAAGKDYPTVARLPNYRFKRVLGSAGFIATTAGQVAALREAGVNEHRIFLVPNMLSILVGEPARLRHDPPVIGAMGRLVAIKGFDVLLRALAWLEAQGHPFRAILAGDGAEKPRLEKLARDLGLKDRIEFSGWISNRSDLFDRLDVLCVPSLEEAFGLVVIEGMAHALPVVVTDSEGPRQIVDHERTGLVVRRGDPIDLGQALERILTDPELEQRLAKGGRAEVEIRYTISANAQRLADALEAVVVRFQQLRSHRSVRAVGDHSFP